VPKKFGVTTASGVVAMVISAPGATVALVIPRKIPGHEGQDGSTKGVLDNNLEFFNAEVESQLFWSCDEYTCRDLVFP